MNTNQARRNPNRIAKLRSPLEDLAGVVHPMVNSRAGEMIDVRINGQLTEIPQGMTVAELLERLRLQPKHVAVERNLNLVPRGEHAACILDRGDCLEIVTLVGGG